MTNWNARKIGLFGIMLLLALIAGLWAWQMRYALSGSAGKHLEVRAAYAKARTGEIVLVDVRRPSEWKASGVPAPAHAITMHQEGGRFVEKLLAASGGRRDKPLALICATGGRTSWLQGHLHKAGFVNLYNVTEGMMGSRHGTGWLKKGLPVRRWTGPALSRPPSL